MLQRHTQVGGLVGLVGFGFLWLVAGEVRTRDRLGGMLEFRNGRLEEV